MSDQPEYLRITISVPPGFAKVRHDLPECWADMGEIERRAWIYDKAHQDMTDAEHSIGWRHSLHYHDGSEVGGDGASDDNEAGLGLDESRKVSAWLICAGPRPTLDEFTAAFRATMRAALNGGRKGSLEAWLMMLAENCWRLDHAK